MKIETGQRLNPNSDLEGKNFFKLWHIIDRDGTVHSRVTLNIPDSELTEGLICKHYLARYTQEVVKSDVFIELISRDNPWDFELLLSTGNKLKIEITVIADDHSMFVKMKREDRLMSRAASYIFA